MAKEKNTIRMELSSIACWGLGDALFDFGSSFLLPETKDEFVQFNALRRSKPGAPMSVFGHADPVGDDTFNKRLSGNRAESVYAVIIHDTARWERLYSTAGASEGWGIRSIQQMLGALGHNPGPVTGASNAATTNAIKNFQSSQGAAQSGTADAATREKLFKAYMTFLNPEPAVKTDFLSQGADPGGKGDFQGCSEFNAAMLFSQAEAQRFSQAQHKAERDQENRVNRRVVVLLFRPGTVIPPAKWPCPKASEGTSGCTKRFWKTHAQRRANQAERREYKNTKDTFACRFYQRLTETSPCEGVVPPIPNIYLRLSFIDPEGVVRRFPAGVPVTVQYGPELSPPGAGEQTYNTLDEGELRFPAWLNTPCQSFTLRFHWTNQIPYLFYEDIGAPSPPAANRYAAVAAGAADPPYLAVPAAAGAPSPPRAERTFSLPSDWVMRQADWYAPGNRPFAPLGPFGGNGAYDPATGRINHTAMPAADIGALGAPVELVLDPHWRQFRFEFFDRYYGNAALNSPPSAGHGRRISTPALWLEGFRNDANAAAADADCVSNWTIGADPKDRIQCLPFVLARDASGAALPAPTGATLGLRFRTSQGAPRTFIVSTSDTVRDIRDVDNSPPGTPAPGPERLKFYDLPRIWKSRNYYTRNLPGSPPPNDGKHFQTLTTAEIQNADFVVTNTNAPRSLNFCLDDIVLTDAALAQLPLGAIASPPAVPDRITLFHHKFGNRAYNTSGAGAGTIANVSNEGVYKPGTAPNAAGYPYSDIQMPVRYYVTDYPDWTRLLLAQGNVYDILDNRTPDVPGNDVVGARAAVRWVDATTAPNGTGAVNAGSGATGTIAARPGPTQQPYFSIQPFHEQEFLVRYNGSNGTNPQAAAIRHNEWSAAYANAPDTIGRYDILLVRCSDYDGADEVGTLLRYLRTDFDFTTASTDNANVVQPNPLLGANNAARMNWAQLVIDNGMARWNGHDGQNDARTWVLPRQSSPPVALPAIRIQILTIFQYLPSNWAHSNIRCAHHNCTSFMNAVTGDGQIRINASTHDDGSPGNDVWGRPKTGRGLAAAHEFGHGLTLPDEYDNNRADRLGYAALNLPGSPYNFENRGLMHFNWFIRARFFWVSSEWIRTLNGFGTVNFSLNHNDSLAPGAPRETNFFLPHYPRPAGNPKRNFVSWPVGFNLRQRSGADTSNFDAYLYAFGDDKYSSVVLPASPTLPGGAGGPRIDGMVLVLLRIQVDFTAITPGANPDRVRARDRFFTALSAAVEPSLNNRRVANFSLVAGAPAGSPSFSRCVLQFNCAYTTVGVATSTTPPTFDAAAPHHLRIVMNQAAVPAPVVASFNNNAPPNAKVLTINLPNNFLAQAQATRDNQMAAAAALALSPALTALGLNNVNPPGPGHFQTAASYVPIIRTVIDPGAGNPNVS